MSAYLVPTKGGNRGPFSVEQLRALVKAGKLPLSYGVIDGDSGEMHALKSLLARVARPGRSRRSGSRRDPRAARAAAARTASRLGGPSERTIPAS